MREVLVNEIKGLYVAEGGFDPPTSGLWAQHASSAPLCQLPFVSFTLHITQFSADAISTSFRTISFARSNRRPFYLDKINAHLLQVVKKKHGRNTVSISNRKLRPKILPYMQFQTSISSTGIQLKRESARFASERHRDRYPESPLYESLLTSLCNPNLTLTLIQIITLTIIELRRSHLVYILGSIVVSIPACHAGDRGSIPRRGGYLFTSLGYFEIK